MSKEQDLEHFKSLAIRGYQPGRSGGEKAAAVLAGDAYQHFLLLDASARRGYLAWLRLFADYPGTCLAEMEGWGYDFD